MKKIVYLTGTRADFGKLKSLINITEESKDYENYIFVTGMHLNKLYGFTADEVYKCGYENIYCFSNHETVRNMDLNLANTIQGFSQYIRIIKPDLIIIHGDRVEALAGAIVGSLNNILVAHIEGGEVSGTIDELIRHAVTKMSHIHLVANKKAADRIAQLGEFTESINIIGSPDLDLMNEKNLPKIEAVKSYYDIEFENYSIAMFHPITTEYDNIYRLSEEFFGALDESNLNYIVVYPNNDLGSEEILTNLNKYKGNQRFKIFPSLRFEYFLRLLESADFIVGNSSSGIMEAPFYGTFTIDVGTRQKNRFKHSTIFHSDYEKSSILDKIIEVKELMQSKGEKVKYFGEGNSAIIYYKLLESKKFWNFSKQKSFQSISEPTNN